jgi:hypothetical protein
MTRFGPGRSSATRPNTLMRKGFFHAFMRSSYFSNGVVILILLIKPLETQNRLQHPSLFHIFYSLANFVKWIECNHPIERETLLEIQLD